MLGLSATRVPPRFEWIHKNLLALLKAQMPLGGILRFKPSQESN